MAYQTLYESSVAFGMRKALQTEQGKSEMAGPSTRRRRRSPTWSGGRRVARECEAIRRARLSEGTRGDQARRGTAFLNRANKQLKQQLDKFLQEPPPRRSR